MWRIFGNFMLLLVLYDVCGKSLKSPVEMAIHWCGTNCHGFISISDLFVVAYDIFIL